MRIRIGCLGTEIQNQETKMEMKEKIVYATALNNKLE